MIDREKRARELLAQSVASKHWGNLIRESNDDNWGVIKPREAIAAMLALADEAASQPREGWLRFPVVKDIWSDTAPTDQAQGGGEVERWRDRALAYADALQQIAGNGWKDQSRARHVARAALAQSLPTDGGAQ
ncbi:MAG TPA: hypothetical protein VF638_14195 [Sphingomonas sp.]|jgi:hypothetical protein